MKMEIYHLPGEYLNELRNGNGAEYNENNILIFQGNYLKERGIKKEKNIMIMDN